MRIIGKEHDYYDSALSYGIDPAIIYLREQVKLEDTQQCLTLTQDFRFYKQGVDFTYEKYGIGPSHEYRYHRDNVVSPGFVGFCGKIYPYYYIRCDEYMSSYERIVWSFDELMTLTQEERFKGARPSEKSGWSHALSYSEANVKEFFEGRTTDEPFLKWNVPIVAVGRVKGSYSREFFLNPVLKNFEFFRVKDPYTAFQELSMYLGGPLVNTMDKQQKISDKDMAAKKGFGHRYAFRKEPGNK